MCRNTTPPDTAEDTPEPDLLVIAVARGPGICHRLETAHRHMGPRGFEVERSQALAFSLPLVPCPVESCWGLLPAS